MSMWKFPIAASAVALLFGDEEMNGNKQIIQSKITALFVAICLMLLGSEAAMAEAGGYFGMGGDSWVWLWVFIIFPFLAYPIPSIVVSLFTLYLVYSVIRKLGGTRIGITVPSILITIIILIMGEIAFVVLYNF